MTKSLNGPCAACGGQIEFPAEAVGTTVDCPLCGRPTELLLATPPPERIVPVRTIIYTIITILILVAGLFAALLAVKRAERMMGRNPAATVPTPASTQNR